MLVFLCSGRAKRLAAGQILFGSTRYPLTTRPQSASRRYSGADKKEKQESGKQQQTGRQHQSGLLGLLFCLGDRNGAGALHSARFLTAAMMRESGGFGKPPAPNPSN
jgi:hypothetical protein